jgi:protein-disulfide isomerase
VRDIASVVLVLCAVAVTGLLVKRELIDGPRTITADTTPVARTLTSDEYQAVVEDGHALGATSPRITVTVFADFECPACRSFALRTMPGVLATFPEDVRVLFRHWPLPYHAAARPFALGAECAAAQGHFQGFHDLAFELQDSLRVLTVREVAHRSGVPDLAEFDACLTGPEAASAVDRDTDLVQRLGGRGTPTVLLDGELLGSPPDSASMLRRLRERLAE